MPSSGADPAILTLASDIMVDILYCICQLSTTAIFTTKPNSNKLQIASSQRTQKRKEILEQAKEGEIELLAEDQHRRTITRVCNADEQCD